MKLRKVLVLITAMVVIATILFACTPKLENDNISNNAEVNDNKVKNKTIIMATTTSTQDSGLLDYILPIFKEDTGIEIKVVAVGTGKAITMGEDGEADVLLVHAKSSEEEFVNAGHGLERFDVMYNDFVLLGPKDKQDIKTEMSSDIAMVLEEIYSKRLKFVSRGDDSGTHKKELSIWKAINIVPEGNWYFSAGKGMGDVIQMANEMLAYTISDRATYLSMKDKLDITIVTEGDKLMFNQYGVIAVNPNKNEKINVEGAKEFIKWILSEKTQKLIGEFGIDIYGEPLFIPNAK